MPSQDTILKRFFDKVEFADNGCWLWRGEIHYSGYGKCRDEEIRHVSAHRWLFKKLRWDPGDLTLDHLCRVKTCVNAFDHLEPVTDKVNVLRGETLAAENAKKTHCPRGHPYDTANTYRLCGHRHCRKCTRIRGRKYAARKRLERV